jgi:hypothetical protein
VCAQYQVLRSFKVIATDRPFGTFYTKFFI